MQNLQLVKNARLEQDDQSIRIIHYDHIILSYDKSKDDLKIDLNCSATSNKMIKRALNFFNLDMDKAQNIHKGKKWNYSGANE